MKRIPTFVAGMLTAAVIGGLGVGALAASGAVTFNASNLQLNGQQISAKGENYTLANGQQVPASITYTDETGGGTTYLPVRRIAELLGVETGWDNATGSVTVGQETGAKVPASTTDYSDWSAEDIAIMLKNDFKSVFEIKVQCVGAENDTLLVGSYPTSNFNPAELVTALKSLGSDFLRQRATEDLDELIKLYPNHNDINIAYWTKNKGAAQVFMSIRRQNGHTTFTYYIVD